MDTDEEAALVREVRESGDEAALANLRAFWLRRAVVHAAIEDAFSRVESVEGRELSIRGLLSILSGRVALAWSGERWEVLAFERDEPEQPLA